MRRLLFLLPLLLLTAGCAHYISAQSRAAVDRAITFSQLRRNPDAYMEKTVMLGGVIMAMTRGPWGTRLEVEEHPLDSRELPDVSIPSGGCFVAVTSEHLDPEQYGEGTLVSLVGKVSGKEVMAFLGARACPVVEAGGIHAIVFEEMPNWGGSFGGM